MSPNQRTNSISLVCQIAALAVTLSIHWNHHAFGNLQQPTPIRPSGCNAETEFHCKLEGRCIALEQRCDFQEQCLDGEDELGCPPERCNFEHDHCYWLDALSGNPHSHDFWRRFPVASSRSRRSAAGQMIRPAPGKPPANTSQLTTRPLTKSATSQSLGALLDELSLGLAERAKFLFVPLRWTRPTASNHLWPRRAEIKTPSIGRTSGACQLRFEYALLSTGADLHAGLPNASGITLQLVASPKGPQSERQHGGGNNSIGLGRQVVWSASHRVARQAPEWSRAEPLEASAKAIGQQHWIVGVAELGHLRNFELSFEAESSVGPESMGDGGGGGGGGSEHCGAKFNQAKLGGKPSSGGGAIPGRENSMHWGQLGRVRNQPINKEHDLLARGGGGGRDEAKLQVKLAQATEVPAKTRSPAAAAGVNFEGALAAIRWLEFRDCRDWPQVGREQAATGADGDRLNNDEDVTNPNPNDELLAMIPDEKCPKDEFTCSSGSCLANKLLCNFHDDCYSLNGQPSYVWPWPKSVPAMSDDESDDLCQIVLGRESFEPGDEKSGANYSVLDNRRESNQMQLYSTSKADKFWHLTGTWPIDRVAIRRPLASNGTEPLAHLASRDHTIRSAEGSFLSLEVPPVVANKANPISYWASITSQWMQRLDEGEFGQCRLKFFLNFILGPTGRPAGNITPADAPKLIIALEHITLSNEAQKLAQQRQQWPFGRQQAKLEKTVDTILHSGLEIDTSQLTTYSRSHSSIELAGLDFWREFNFELVNLKEGDFFQLRLVLLIQIQANPNSGYQRRVEPLGSVNIDDMATHFGCGLVEDSHQLLHLNKMALPYWQMNSPKLADYVKPHRPNRTEAWRRQLPPLKNKWNRFKTSAPERPPFDGTNYAYEVEPSARGLRLPDEDDSSSGCGGNGNKLRRHFEQVPPHLLVAYVLFAFCLILGLIALIVFVMVPHVERAMMHHQNQIQLSLSGEISDVPATSSQPSTSDFLSISPSGSTRAGSLFGGAFDRFDDETHFSAVRNLDVTRGQSQ